MKSRTAALFGAVILAGAFGVGCKNLTYDERVSQMDYLYRAGAYNAAGHALYKATDGDVGGELVTQNANAKNDEKSAENAN